MVSTAQNVGYVYDYENDYKVEDEHEHITYNWK